MFALYLWCHCKQDNDNKLEVSFMQCGLYWGGILPPEMTREARSTPLESSKKGSNPPPPKKNNIIFPLNPLTPILTPQNKIV